MNLLPPIKNALLVTVGLLLSANALAEIDCGKLISGNLIFASHQAECHLNDDTNRIACPSDDGKLTFDDEDDPDEGGQLFGADVFK
ncbi:MAG: hypothetical protein HOO92_16255 [Methylococcaceae bacterium]|nr:hypothetical protein [Methylococcaceae bacterium]